MNAGLIVSRMMADGMPITDERLYSEGKSRVRGLSGSIISKILEQHGETRVFTREGDAHPEEPSSLLQHFGMC